MLSVFLSSSDLGWWVYHNEILPYLPPNLQGKISVYPLMRRSNKTRNINEAAFLPDPASRAGLNWTMSFNKAFPAYKKIDELIPKGLVIRMNNAAIPFLPILTTLHCYVYLTFNFWDAHGFASAAGPLTVNNTKSLSSKLESIFHFFGLFFIQTLQVCLLFYWVCWQPLLEQNKIFTTFS